MCCWKSEAKWLDSGLPGMVWALTVEVDLNILLCKESRSEWHTCSQKLVICSNCTLKNVGTVSIVIYSYYRYSKWMRPCHLVESRIWKRTPHILQDIIKTSLQQVHRLHSSVNYSLLKMLNKPLFLRSLCQTVRGLCTNVCRLGKWETGHLPHGILSPLVQCCWEAIFPPCFPTALWCVCALPGFSWLFSNVSQTCIAHKLW